MNSQNSKAKKSWMRTPRSLDLEITHNCNLRCKYCSYYSSPGDVSKDLPAWEWLVFFEELNQCAVTNLTLTGGEAFYRKDLISIINGIVKNRMRFTILSNGTLVTEKLAEFIASTGRCDIVQVSIDGPDPESHDSICGKGSFMKAINGIRILQKYRVPVTVRATIHRQNIEDLDKIATFLFEDIGLSSFSTNSAEYLGLCQQNSEQVKLTVNERSKAMEKLLDLKRKYSGRIHGTAGPLAEAQIWGDMENAFIKGIENFPGGGCLSSCNGVFTKLAVRADGIIVPCSLLSHIELGRINHNDLLEIWHNHPELLRLRERQQFSLGEFELCNYCKYRNYCRGGCPGVAYNLTGSDCHPNPDSCLKLFLDEGGTLPDYNTQVEENEAK